jgi:hypothetical protein
MSDSYASLPDLVVPSGQVVSNVLPGVYTYHDAKSLELYGTDGAYPEAATLEVNQDQNATNASSGWVTANDAGADLTPPAAGKSKSFGEAVIGAGSLRIKLAGAAAANRTWKANKKWIAYSF